MTKKINQKLITIICGLGPALLVAAAVVLAAAGMLDPSFGNGGIVITDLGGYDYGIDVALQPDGKIVVAGGSNRDLAVARYHSDGGLDASFGTGGIVVTDLGGDDDASAVALQPDGKIVVAGVNSQDNAFEISTVTRYHTNGNLDTSFGTGGTAIAPSERGIPDVAVQTDGKIIIAGNNNQDFMVGRYHSDGAPDTAFGTAGFVATDLGGADYGYGLALQIDGKIIVAGYSEIGGNSDFALARYHSDGMLDTAFGTAGFVTTDLGGDDFGAVVALQVDGKIVAAGGSDIGDNDNGNFAVARYHSDGSLDSSFGTDGIVVTNVGGDFEEGRDLILQPDGKIIVAGHRYTGNNVDFALVRYNNDGSLDDSFGINGLIITDLGGSDYASAVALQSDGKIVVVGDSDGDFALVRYADIPPAITLASFEAEADGDRLLVRWETDNEVGYQGFNLARAPSSTGPWLNLNPALIPTTGGFNTGASYAFTDTAVAPGQTYYYRLEAVDTGGDSTFFQPVAAMVQPPNLDLTKTVDDETVSPGRTVTYTVTLRNQGSAAVDQIVISDTLPAGLSFAGPVTQEPPEPQSQPPTPPILASDLTLAAGQAVTLTYPVSVDSNTPDNTVLTNSVFMSGSGVLTPSLSAQAITVRAIDLTLRKTVDVKTPRPGQSVTYTIRVNNDGIISATNTLISDTLPAGLTFAGPVTLEPPGTQLPPPTSPILADGLIIAAGQALTLTYPVLVDAGLADGAVLTNRAAITGPGLSAPVSGSASLTVTTALPPAERPLYLPLIIKQ